MLIRNRAVLASAFALALSVSLAAEAERRPPADPAMIAARSRIFGPENVDQRSGQVESRARRALVDHQRQLLGYLEEVHQPTRTGWTFNSEGIAVSS